MDSVQPGRDGPTAVGLPFMQPHLVAQNHMHGHTTAVYNCTQVSGLQLVANKTRDRSV